MRPGGCFSDLDLVLDMAFAAADSAQGDLYARGAPSRRPAAGEWEPA
ncbi:MAG: hypothetical protein ACRDTX_20720 [Pseudonocardiaceae bacterium]